MAEPRTHSTGGDGSQSMKLFLTLIPIVVAALIAALAWCTWITGAVFSIREQTRILTQVKADVRDLEQTSRAEVLERSALRVQLQELKICLDVLEGQKRP